MLIGLVFGRLATDERTVRSELRVPEVGRRCHALDPHRQPGSEPLVPLPRRECGCCGPGRCACDTRAPARRGHCGSELAWVTPSRQVRVDRRLVREVRGDPEGEEGV